jgi:hypothetical protein
MIGRRRRGPAATPRCSSDPDAAAGAGGGREGIFLADRIEVGFSLDVRRRFAQIRRESSYQARQFRHVPQETLVIVTAKV